MNQIQMLLIFTFLFMSGTILLVLLLMFFGRLIWLQIKIWLLARRGYMQIDHVGEDKVHRFYYLRPKEGKFDIKGGCYILQDETITKVMEIIKRPAKGLGKEGEKGDAADNTELAAIIKVVGNLQYNKDAVTLRWGIPTIEYYGDDPQPILHSERKKLYSAGIINNIILKILTMRNFKLFQKWFMIIAIAGGVIAVALIIIGMVMRQNSINMNQCIQILNITQGKLEAYLRPLVNATVQNASDIVRVVP